MSMLPHHIVVWDNAQHGAANSLEQAITMAAHLAEQPSEPNPKFIQFAKYVQNHFKTAEGSEKSYYLDFDNEVQASASLDAVTALLSPLFHPDSPIRSSTWPSVEQCRHLMDAQFLADCPWFAWMARAQLWASRSSSSSRELWALVLGYTARQLKHEDVYSDGVATTRAMTLAKLATESFDSD